MISVAIRFWKLLDRGDRWLLSLTLVLVAAGSILETMGVAILPVLIAVLSSTQLVLQKIASVTGHPEVLRWNPARAVLAVAITVGVFFLLKNLFSMWVVYRQGLFKSYIQAKLGRRLFHGYLHAPYAWHLNHNSADMQQNMQNEVTDCLSRIITPVFTMISEIAIIAMAMSLLMWIAPLATLLTLLLIGSSSALYYYIFRVRLQAWGKVQNENRTAIYQCLHHGLGGIKELKVLGRLDYFEEQYDRLIDSVTRADEFSITISTNVKAVLEGIAVLSLSIIVIVLTVSGVDMQAILPTLAFFAVAAIRLMPSANRVVVSQSFISYGMHGFCRLLSDLEEVRPFSRRADAVEKPEADAVPWTFNREIRLSGISYRYPEAREESLSEIEVTIRKGESVAFVGESGAGKTTLVDLILGLLQPTQGVISVDGKDIQAFLSTWQRHIGYIPQSIYLSDDSIRGNVAFGLPPEQISDEQVWAALDAAQLSDLVRQWPEKLDKLIGERGVRLSGGQRQRIGIARAFYHNPSILIMDEATAALDNETEREIVSVLEKFHGEKTLMTIAHRLTTVQGCDTIFFLNAGRIIASGSYDQLRKESPHFQRMILAATSSANSGVA